MSILGTDYAVGMLLPFGQTGGLPDFAEIIQIIIVHKAPFFAVKVLSAWYDEHFRAFEVEYTRRIEVLGQSQLADVYPLAAYTVAGRQMVSLKHFICASE